MLKRAVKEEKDSRRRQKDWELEKDWVDFLVYPVRTLPCAVVLAAGWATLFSFLGFIMPARWDGAEILARCPIALLAFLLFGYTIAYLQMTFSTARSGKYGLIAWPAGDLKATVRGGVYGLFTFLAGPIVPVVVGAFFWLGSGEMRPIDWLILWELGILAVGYWALGLLAVEENGRLSQLLPAAVMANACRHGFRTFAVAVLLSLPMVGQIMATLADVDRAAPNAVGWLVRVLSWTLQLSWSVYLLRAFGVHCFRTAGVARSQKAEAVRCPPSS